jgi:hypothetical protein
VSDPLGLRPSAILALGSNIAADRTLYDLVIDGGNDRVVPFAVSGTTSAAIVKKGTVKPYRGGRTASRTARKQLNRDWADFFKS